MQESVAACVKMPDCFRELPGLHQVECHKTRGIGTQSQVGSLRDSLFWIGCPWGRTWVTFEHVQKQINISLYIYLPTSLYIHVICVCSCT